MAIIKNVITLVLLFVITLVHAQDKMSRISVSGNQFITEDGKTIVFRGLNTSDPDKLEEQGHWNKAYFQEMKNWGANIVRFPVHPPAWLKRGKENYVKLLDDGIKWAEELGMYVIIDWHSIGNLRTEMYQRDIYDTTKKQTFDFWRIIGKRYGNNTTVAFYELFNEPTTYNKELGTITWSQWKELNKEMIIIVRANGGKGIPLVAGFNWAYDLTPVKDSPLGMEGIAYVSHPYPQKRDKPWEDKWTKDWKYTPSRQGNYFKKKLQSYKY